MRIVKATLSDDEYGQHHACLCVLVNSEQYISQGYGKTPLAAISNALDTLASRLVSRALDSVDIKTVAVIRGGAHV